MKVVGFGHESEMPMGLSPQWMKWRPGASGLRTVAETITLLPLMSYPSVDRTGAQFGQSPMPSALRTMPQCRPGCLRRFDLGLDPDRLTHLDGSTCFARASTTRRPASSPIASLLLSRPPGSDSSTRLGLREVQLQVLSPGLAGLPMNLIWPSLISIARWQ